MLSIPRFMASFDFFYAPSVSLWRHGNHSAAVESWGVPGGMGRSPHGPLGGPMLAIEDVKLYGTRLASAVAGTSFPVAVM
jgi:hypothetical protein